MQNLIITCMHVIFTGTTSSETRAQKTSSPSLRTSNISAHSLKNKQKHVTSWNHCQSSRNYLTWYVSRILVFLLTIRLLEDKFLVNKLTSIFDPNVIGSAYSRSFRFQLPYIIINPLDTDGE